jgi:hypothetical protein
MHAPLPLGNQSTSWLVCLVSLRVDINRNADADVVCMCVRAGCKLAFALVGCSLSHSGKGKHAGV